MQFNDPLPPPVSMMSSALAVVDVRALRAALRLVLAPGDADEAARRLPEGGDLEDLGPVMRDAVGRARIERWQARLPWRGGEADDRLLGPASRVGAEAAIALALGVGLRLDGRDLADVLDVRVERVGEWLVEGRRALDREMTDPCRKTAWLVGRYEDRSLDPDERVELLTHLNRCPTCQTVVERSRVVDAAIAGEFGRLRGSIEDRPLAGVSRLERTRRGALVAGVVLVAVMALVTGGAAISRLVEGSGDPVPLVAARAPATYSGWMLTARGDGSVQARNLASGETRWIFNSDDPIGSVSAQVLLSPDGTRLMTYYGEYSQSSRSRVVVNALDGREVGRVEWSSAEGDMFYPTGWVDERRILVSVFPVYQQGQNAESFDKLYLAESRLVVVDVETGAEREILRGNVIYGVPSPDGRFVAVARVAGEDTAPVINESMRLEIWPIEAGETEQPVVSIGDWNVNGGGFVWSKDGSRIFMLQAVEADEQQPTPQTEGRTIPNSAPHALVAIGVDGTVQRLVEAGGDTAIYPVSAAVDGSSVVYLHVEGANVLPAISYWRVGVDGSAPEQLSGEISEAFGGSGVVWSPDGETLLLSEVTVPYLDPESSGWSRWGASATDVVAIGPDGERTRLLTTYSVGDQLLGWLPDDALPDRADGDDRFAFTAPEPVAGVPDATRLDEGSAASRDGTFLTLDDLSVGSPLVWETASDDTQRLRGSIEDAIWLPGTRGLLSVSGGREGSRSASRLSVLASTNPYAPLALEPIQFDPISIDGDRERRYAAPQVSPDGLNSSFFVVDRTGGIDLWIANEVGGVSRVAGWRLPGDRIVEPELVAGWVDDRTLVFAEPRDWTRGMPETAALRRLTVADDGSATVEDVIELVGRGDDKGIVLFELAFSGDGAEVAWRVRHYTEWAADDGRFDTIHLAPADDLTRDVELTRGSPGDGLAWSVDGDVLLVGIDREVLVAEPGDLSIEVISGDLSASHPLWVGEDEIWFSAGDDEQVMRVRMRGE